MAVFKIPRKRSNITMIVNTNCRFQSCPKLATYGGSRSKGPRKQFGHECSRGCPISTRHAARSSRYYAVLGRVGVNLGLSAPGMANQTNERRFERSSNTRTLTPKLWELITSIRTFRVLAGRQPWHRPRPSVAADLAFSEVELPSV